jgi:HAD superfamily hydrolase (TIGR01549 family)
MNLKGIMFDFDGTLADTLPVSFGAFRQIFLENLGETYGDGEIAELFGPSEVGILQEMIPDHWETALERYLELYKDLHTVRNIEIPGITSLLTMILENNIPMAVVTGKGMESAKISLEQLNLERFFQIVEAGSAQKAQKPAAIKRILKHWRASASEVIYIGDSTYDMKASKETGVVPIAAAWSNLDNRIALEREQPYKLFLRVDELQDWLISECDLTVEE